MRYPAPLAKGHTIGLAAPSLGVTGPLADMLDDGIQALKQLGYTVVEAPSVRQVLRGASAPAKVRAAEFMALYLDESVDHILAVRGGELLMDMLPYLDYEVLKTARPKWVIGFSDISTLLFTLTLKADLAGAHGPLGIHFGDDPMDFTAANALACLQYGSGFTQKSLGCADEDFDGPLDWLLLGSDGPCNFSGRLIGGGLDTIRTLIGTPFAPVTDFIEAYKSDGFIWFMESCAMKADDLYKTLWQMKQNGWFEHCSGVIYGRPDEFEPYQGLELTDVLFEVFGDMDIPVVYNADLGHIPPQLTFISGAWAEVTLENGAASIRQFYR